MVIYTVFNWVCIKLNIYIMNSVYTSSFSLLLQGHPWSYFSLQEIWPQEHFFVTLFQHFLKTSWLVGVTDVHMTVWNPTEINSALSHVASSLSGPSLCLPAALPAVPYALCITYTLQWSMTTAHWVTTMPMEMQIHVHFNNTPYFDLPKVLCS